MIDPHGGSQNFARRNRGAACIFSDEGFLEKEIHGIQRGVDELFLTSCIERVFCFHLVSS